MITLILTGAAFWAGHMARYFEVKREADKAYKRGIQDGQLIARLGK